MKDFINWIKGSFEEKGAVSSKKCTAFAITALVVITHLAWLKGAFRESDFSLLSEILIIDFSFITACFGIKEFGSVMKSKNQTKPETP